MIQTEPPPEKSLPSWICISKLPSLPGSDRDKKQRHHSWCSQSNCCYLESIIFLPFIVPPQPAATDCMQSCSTMTSRAQFIPHISSCGLYFANEAYDVSILMFLWFYSPMLSEHFRIACQIPLTTKLSTKSVKATQWAVCPFHCQRRGFFKLCL